MRNQKLEIGIFKQGFTAELLNFGFSPLTKTATGKPTPFGCTTRVAPSLSFATIHWSLLNINDQLQRANDGKSHALPYPLGMAAPNGNTNSNGGGMSSILSFCVSQQPMENSVESSRGRNCDYREWLSKFRNHSR
ncbi:MAG: hypothetical protein F6J89_02960 [Symploca sp. SIO1C4]|uniref:Uncharacterized protein n=1 Tax=Symploca sp. SIO1C4 TaxID=2607765 RepID=A0A6B3N4Y5_9CYAN|nr:hypothetical protein [Symploca sp. SIO1C4]